MISDPAALPEDTASASLAAWRWMPAAILLAIILGVALAHVPVSLKRPFLTPILAGALLAMGARRLLPLPLRTAHGRSRVGAIIGLAALAMVGTMHGEALRTLHSESSRRSAVDRAESLQLLALLESAQETGEHDPAIERRLRSERIGLEPTLPDYLRWRILGLHHRLWQWFVPLTMLEAALTAAAAWGVCQSGRARSVTAAG